MKKNLEKENIEDVYPMSDIEMGMVYHSLKNPAASVYHNQMVFNRRVEGFDPEILRKVMILLVKKHPILRTGFNMYDSHKPVQIVYKKTRPDIEHYDISHLERKEQENYVQQKMVEDKQIPYDLMNSESLWRMRTFSLGNENICFMWTCHHAILDGWSSASLMTELNNTYLKLESDPYFVPEKLKSTYKEFVIEQIIEKKKPHTINYWKKELEGYKRFEFPAAPGNSQKLVEPASRKVYETVLGESFLDKLNNTAVRYDTSLKHLCFGAYIYMLNMLSYEGDIVVGLVTNNRPACEDGEKILGCFLNTVPVRVKIPPHIKWSDYIRMVDKKLKGLAEYDRLSLLEIARGVGIEIQDQNPIFDTLFSFVDFHVYKGLNRQEVQNTGPNGFERKLSITVEPSTNTLFDFNVDITSECLSIAVCYSNSLTSDEMVKKCCSYFENILDKFIHGSDMLIEKDQLIYLEEKKKLLYEFNDTAAGYPKDKTIHRLFAEQAARTPDHTALIGKNPKSRRDQIRNPKQKEPFGQINACGESSAHELHELQEKGTRGLAPLPVHVTYRELNKKSGQLAHLLRRKGVGPDIIVGIMMERSVEIIIGILGILKAGGAYLPIDPEYPNERIRYMLSNSSTDILVTKENMLAGISFAGEQIYLDNRDVYEGNTSPGDIKNKPSHLIYIIYTSGSTGKPKGVMVEHVNVVRLFFNDKFQFDFNEKDIWTMFHSPCFDFSVWEMYGALLYGGKLIIIPRITAKDQFEYYKILQNEGVTVLNQTPSAFYNLIREDLSNKAQNLELRYVIFGGEALKPGKLKDWHLKYPGVKLINMYGITETTVHVTYKEISHYEIEHNISNIGKPIPTLSTYILDSNLQLNPIGVAGELCIGGAGVSRGYLRNPGLTSERFISNPYKPGEKLYKSGDLARVLENGEMEYLGRIDKQVKIRGFRIELGEIETNILKIGGIKEAVVVDMEDDTGDKHLCAYVVTSQAQSSAGSKVAGKGKLKNITWTRKKLSENLPDYMIPSYFVELEKIPLTPNGKIDRKALPEPEVVPGVDYVAPRSEVEKRLCQVWGEVLGAKEVGIRENFFELGGDSIKAIQVAARLQKYQLKLFIADLFTYPRISELSSCISKVKWQIDQEPVEGEIPLTPIQEWFFEQQYTDSHHFNQSLMLYSQKGFSEARVKQVFVKILEHHDVLRVVYKREGESVVQVNKAVESNHFDMVSYDFRDKPEVTEVIRERAQQIQGSIDITRGPLVKLGLFKTSAGDHLLIVIHHLVVDGVSWRIILEDFAGAYDQLTGGKAITFASKTHSFKYWSQCLARYSQSRELLREIPYWRVIEEAEAALLPVDYEIDPSQRVFGNQAAVIVVLDKENTKKLLSGSSRAYNTEINDLLLTALGLAVSQWSKSSNVLVNLEGHGREDIVPEVVINRTVGWFTTQYPVLLEIKNPGDISYRIRHTKETLRGIPRRGIGYGILRYITLKEKLGGLVFKQEPEISFNYLGEFGSDTTETLHYSMSNMPQGNPTSPDLETGFKININGLTADGQLRLTFSYNKEEYEERTIKGLSESCREYLLEIIHHCVGSSEVVKTPSDYGCRQLSLEDMEKIEEHVKNNIDKDKGAEISEIYPLSPMQVGMLFHAQLFPLSSMYLEQNVIYLKGEIDAELLERSFSSVIARYDILRTFFVNEGLPEPLQVVLSHRSIKIDYRDISHLDASAQDLYIEDFKQEDKQNTFDLSIDHLFRVSLLRTSSNSGCLIWSHHHILMDGWCLSLIYRDLLFAYNALKTGKETRFTEVTPYRRYIDWLRSLDKEDGMAYWESYLYGYDEKITLPRLSMDREDLLYDQQELTLDFSEEVTRELGRISAGNRVTINTMMQTIWGILLHKYNNCNDAVFGAVVSGRPAEVEGIEEMVGLFINTVPVRVKREEGDIFADLVKRVQQEVLAAKKHEFFPLAEIQTLTRHGRSLIDHIMVFENYPVNEELKSLGSNAAVGFTVEDMEIFEQTNYDFNIAVLPGRSLFVKFTYNGSLYARDLVEKLAGHFNNLVDRVLAEPGQEISELDILSAQERRQLLYEFNDTAVDYPKDKTIHRLFAEQADTAPDRIALIGPQTHSDEQDTRGNDISITYKELNEKSNQLAHLLMQKGVKPDTIVAIMMERSLEMIIGLLGILKAGGAYMPIDPDYPQERIQYMLIDANVKILVKNSNIFSEIKVGKKLFVLDFDPLNFEFVSNFEFRACSLRDLSPSNLAYIIYTSGTTGKSKGVMIEHRNVVRLMFNDRFLFDFSHHDVWTMFHSYCFDFSVWEMYGALLYGGKLVLIPKMTTRDPHRYLETLKEEKVTILNQTPAAFYNLSHHELEIWGKAKKLNLKYVIFGGEALNPIKLKRWKEKYPETRLINMFGITETTVHVTYKELEDKDIDFNISNIGQPIPTLSTYVMDKNLKFVPPEAAGELCVGGEGVGRGYLNRPALTGEKFVENLYIPGEKLYRSGDLVKLSGNGDMEYLGRIDHQVKIRGFRVELGEIEYRLLRHEAVKEAVVTVRSKDKEDKYLCAYIVSDVEFTGSELGAFLSLELPDYMIPAYFVPLENIPLTANGKVDRKALPEPEFMAGEDYTAPRNKVEEKLLELWTDILGIDNIGVNSHFFELGGNSLNIMTLISRIHREFDIRITLGEIFNSPTIEKQAVFVQGAQQEAYQSIASLKEQEYYDVSSAQRRVWVLSQIEDASIAFNMPMAFFLEGELNKEAFARVFETLVERHESLRTVFVLVNDEIKQKIVSLDQMNFKLEFIDLPGVRLDHRESKAKELVAKASAAPFDLRKGPLLRAMLVQLEDHKYVFHFNMHHIASDLLSIEVLVREVFILYNAYKKGEANPLSPLPIHYKDYAAWQNRQLKGEYLENHRLYWLNQVKERPPVLELPLDKPRPKVQTYKGDHVGLTIPGPLADALKVLSNQHDATLFMTLLAALNVLLYYYTGSSDIVIGTLISGRQHAELEDQIGYYLNTLALRTRFDVEERFLTLMSRVRKVMLEAFEHQAYPFDKLVEDLGGERDASRHPLFDVVIDMQNITHAKIPNINMELKITPFESGHKSCKFDLTFYIREGKSNINIDFEYNIDIFEQETIKLMGSRLCILLEKIVKNPDILISDFDLDEVYKIPSIGAISRKRYMERYEGIELKIKASYHQERLWFIDTFESGNIYDSSPIYHNIPLILEIDGLLDNRILEQSLQAVINRHEALRSRIITINNEPLQWIEPNINFKLQVVPLANESGNGLYQRAINLAVEKVKQPFLLDREPLIRAFLIQVTDEKNLLAISIHHIISDRSSLEILAREMMLHYKAYLNKKSPRLPGLSIHYADFSIFQRELPGEVLESLLFYWRRQLGRGLQPLELPTDFPRTPIHIFREERKDFELPQALSEKIRHFSHRTAASNFVVLLAAFKVLLYRYSGQDEIMVGTIADNRTQPGTEHVIGPIANLLALRSHLSSNLTFANVLSNMNKIIDKAYMNQDLPFDKLLQELNPDRYMSRTALFDVLFQYEDCPFEMPAIDNLQIKIFETNLGWGKYDLNLLMRGGGGNKKSFTGILVYNSDYYKASTISRFINHYINFLEGIWENPDKPIYTIPLLTEEEKHQLLVDWNQTRANYPKDKTIVHLFEEQVEKTPANTAVVFEDIRLTYRELNRRVNRLSHYFRVGGHIRGNDLMGVVFERSHRMIIGLLAILKAGGAYVPIDPNYPEERINFILNDSACGRIITNDHFKDKISKYFNGVLITLNAKEKKYRDKNKFLNNPAPLNNPEDIAYVIYTSGTTGFPKGCLISHRNVVRLMNNDKNPFDFNDHDVWIMAHSYCFDFSVWEMYGPLLSGGKLVVPRWDNVRDVGTFLSIIKAHKVTVLNQTPASFHSLAAEEMQSVSKTLNQHLRYVIFGGDRLDTANLKEWADRYPLTNIALINMYGITETTVHVTYYKLKREDIHSSRTTSPIGSALPETTIYICDTNLTLVPVGVTGELYVGGTGVSKGYLNRSMLTLERFIKNPYNPGETLYRTGDLGRWLTDGTIEYLGRNDEQVKIRGYRIELGEIENQLLTHDGIIDAVVISREKDRGDRYLCAYIVSEKALDISEIKNHLSRELPGYMIPTYFVKLARLPLTPNRKIDKRALPEPEFTQVAYQQYQAPQDKVDKKLVEIWGEVLSIEKGKISIDSNFFELGGHSLKAAVLISKIHKELDVKIPLAEIFTTPFIKGMREYIKSHKEFDYGESFVSIKPAEEKEYYLLSPAQYRLYVIHQMDPQNTVYNMPLFVTFEGELEKDRVENAFLQLIRRHESFRTSFAVIEEKPVQRIHQDVEFEMEYYDLKKTQVEVKDSDEEGTKGLAPLPIEPATSTIKNFIRPFNLSQAPLIRVGLIKIEEEKHVLMLDMHHIITDGSSHHLFVKDLMASYQGETLSPLPFQYRDYSEWQQGSRAGTGDQETLKHQEAFWLKQIAGEIPVLSLCCDYPRPPVQSFEGSSIHFSIDKPGTDALKNLALEKNITLYMVLLAIFNLLLSKLSGQEEIIVGTPVAGRRHADLHRIIGMFVNTLVIRSYPLSRQSFNGFLQQVKETTLAAFENQEYPFEALVEKAAAAGSINRDMSRNPLFDVMFVLQNTAVKGGTNQPADETALKTKPYHYEFNISKFDITLNVAEALNQLNFQWEYCTRLFKKETIQRFIGYFKRIVSAVTSEPLIKLAEVDIIPGEEKQQLLFDFNQTVTQYPQDKTIHRLFEEQAEKGPDRVAVVGSKQLAIGKEGTGGLAPLYITYRELNKKANRLAYLLIEKGVQPDTIVGIMVERSIEMLIGILGILKAGGAYLPIDPAYPEERINYMLADSSANLLLTNPHLSSELEKLSIVNCQLLMVNEESTARRRLNNPSKEANSINNYQLTINNLQLKGNNLAYVIYTSGTTGKPKGTPVRHRNVNNYSTWFKREFQIGVDDKFCFAGSFCFDMSVTTLIVPLISGASIYTSREKIEQDPQVYTRFLAENTVSIVKLTPTQFRPLQDFIRDEDLGSLRYIILGGEAVDVNDIRHYLSIYKHQRIVNEYGPTEAAVATVFHVVSGNDFEGPVEYEPSRSSLPIGRPVSNTRIYILDKYTNLVPSGVVGELCIGGESVAPGYLNKPELAAEKFIKLEVKVEVEEGKTQKGTKELFPYLSTHPLICSPIYRTGDLARWLPDGSIEFLGRIDHQVKVRGFRIELGEIENRLLKHQHIKEVVISTGGKTGAPGKAVEGDEIYVCAYFVSDLQLTVTDLREYLARHLPDYMLPAYFVQIEKIPITPNGKVDRKALPLPLSDGSRPKLDVEYAAPKSVKEKIIANIWKEVLKLKKVGIHDNFFDIGGNSLKLIQLNNKLKKALNRDIPVVHMFEYPSINMFLTYLSTMQAGDDWFEKEIEQLDLKHDNAVSTMEQTLQVISKD